MALQPCDTQSEHKVSLSLHSMNPPGIKATDDSGEPAVERAELRAHQDEGRGYGSGLQESVQIVHHPGRQHNTVL
ncbi:hypothetical protein EYF80_016827 [Liparis tanakae]|uniref:Uncharacterized protein n=1 Tax=Liparis tanakae TaxID=230148 RepID=A0A4Z2I4L1_9TELE|nr:hypothetical protein EYF80_016827 [Liparis tanakae]